MQEQISTVELIKAGWPILVGFVGVVIFVGRLASMTYQNREDLKSFLDKAYPSDKEALTTAVRDVRMAQEKIEEKLEQKLDRMAESNDRKFDQLFGETNKANVVLAEIKGRLYPKNSASIND